MIKDVMVFRDEKPVILLASYGVLQFSKFRLLFSVAIQ